MKTILAKNADGTFLLLVEEQAADILVAFSNGAGETTPPFLISSVFAHSPESNWGFTEEGKRILKFERKKT